MCSSRPKTGLPSSVPWNVSSAICPAAGDAFFFTKHFPKRKMMQFSSQFFFKHERCWKKAILYWHSHRFAHQRNWLCDSALPKEKPFYCRNSYNDAFRYVFQSPCKTLWQIFSAETTGWERTHNSRGSQREVRFAEFFLSSEGKNDDLVSLQDL